MRRLLWSLWLFYGCLAFMKGSYTTNYFRHGDGYMFSRVVNYISDVVKFFYLLFGMAAPLTNFYFRFYRISCESTLNKNKYKYFLFFSFLNHFHDDQMKLRVTRKFVNYTISVFTGLYKFGLHSQCYCHKPRVGFWLTVKLTAFISLLHMEG